MSHIKGLNIEDKNPVFRHQLHSPSCMWAGDDLEVATGRRVVVHLVARGLTRALELGQLGTVATSTTLQKSDDNITT